jgi:hypothetical protein
VVWSLGWLQQQQALLNNAPELSDTVSHVC